MKKWAMLATAVTLVSLISSRAMAEQSARTISDVTVIEHPEGGSQIAFRWDPSIPEGNVAVRQALLRFELQGNPIERSRTIRVYPITSNWSPGSPSVEYDEGFWTRTELDFSRNGPAVVDLTALVKDIVEADMTSYGFLLTVGPGDEPGLDEAEVARFGGLSTGTVDVKWRSVPQVPSRVEG